MGDKHLSYVDRAAAEWEQRERECNCERREAWAEGRRCNKCGEIFDKPLPDRLCPKCEQLAIEKAYQEEE